MLVSYSLPYRYILCSLNIEMCVMVSQSYAYRMIERLEVRCLAVVISSSDSTDEEPDMFGSIEC
ncbi:hypothetical protein TUM12370_33690 [Salmonella enterica subsp. enterica serovar Choleraesuis]|nr:hypothetical protein TUM12370_33690 [Salmonella enterica subsp. enterica serovar Choleraesuis]